MKRFYISHPFAGDEEKNRQEARDITAKLIKQFPEFDFINPLDAGLAYKQAGADYDRVLAFALNLLRVCNGIIMTGDWYNSRGCKAELEKAIVLSRNPIEAMVEVYLEPAKFMAAHTNPVVDEEIAF